MTDLTTHDSDSNSVPVSTPKLTFHIDLGKDRGGSTGVLASAISGASEIVNWKRVDNASAADILVRYDFTECQALLKSGRTVVQVGFSKTEGPYEVLARAYPDRYYFVNFIHPHDGRMFLLALNDIKLPERPVGLELPKERDPDLPDNLEESQLSGKQILVMDDKELNRRSALAQFGALNEVKLCGQYKEVLEFLNDTTKPRPDLVLLDLLMPVEALELGAEAKQKHFGSEFPAGIFVALAAAKRGVPLIIIQTDASHHDHPATAILDYLGWNSTIKVEQSRIVLGRALTKAGVKDWAAGLTGYLDVA